jgi:hypothetical protein
MHWLSGGSTVFTYGSPLAWARPIVLLALVALIQFPSVSFARDPLRWEMKTVSEKLRDYFAGRRVKELAVGDVTNADPTTPSTSGPGIRQLLIEELGRAELKVKLRADVGLTVTYRARKIPLKNNRLAEQVVVEMRFTALFNADNSQEDILSYRVENDEANRHILGLSVPPVEKGTTREQQTLLAYTKPKANLDGTAILAGERAPFGLEILVDDKPIAPKDEDGFGLVTLEQDQTYAIRVLNRSALEIAVHVSVDGFNIFTFSELRQEDGAYKGAPLYDMVLIPAKGSLTIPGWHRTNTTSDKFKITEYAKTAAARMNKNTDIGTITATFCAAWEKIPPDDEPSGARAPGDDGTGFGEPKTVNYEPVKRTIGAVRASVAVRYKVPHSSN